MIIVPKPKKIDRLKNAIAVRSIFSLIIIFGWLIFVTIYLAFYSHDFSLFQTIAIIFASLVFAIMMLSIMWTWWGINFGTQMIEKSNKKNEK